ncbi:MAG: HlyD family efflux transporter periplasmic adaptor subunit [Planctomycetota bacterium]
MRPNRVLTRYDFWDWLRTTSTVCQLGQEFGLLTSRRLLFACLAFCSTSLAAQNSQPISLEGTARFSKRSNLTFGSTGRILRLDVEEGSRVRSGQVLGTLMDGKAEAVLAEALARVSAQGSLGAAEARLRAASLELEAAKNANLRSPNAFSPQEIRLLQEQFAVASELVTAEKDALKIAEAAVETARADLNALRLLAPYDGLIVRKMHTEGEGVDPVTAIYELVETSRVRIEFFIPEASLDKFEFGTRLSVTNPKNSKDATCEARVDFVDVTIQPVRRVVRAWTDIPRPVWMLDGTRVSLRASQDKSVAPQDDATTLPPEI